MTEVVLYFGLDARIEFLARLLAKHIVGKGLRAVVLFDDENLLQDVSKHLWESGRERAIPNCFADDREADLTPVILTLAGQGGFPAQEKDVLVNFSSAVPEGFSSFGKVLELIGANEESLHEGERRKNFYQERGYAIKRHEMKGKRH